MAEVVIMFDEIDLLPISAIQHLAFCPRQCALIHLERTWEENRLTAEGRLLHERTHQEGRELRGNILTVRALSLRSLKLGLIGQADVVEFHRCGVNELLHGVTLAGLKGEWQPFPVEYKRGLPKQDNVDKVQLCCHAICLEEMLEVSVPAGALFYGASRRRFDVEFPPELRANTASLAADLHLLINEKLTPKATYASKCKNCSLAGVCMPHAVTGRKSVASYLAMAFATHDEEVQKL